MWYFSTMTRHEAIAEINARLATLDDDDVRAVADLGAVMGEPSELPRALSERELGLIAQSRSEFEKGETLSTRGLDDFLNAAAAKRAAARGV